MSSYTISDDKSKLDINFIHSFITNSYWGKGRSHDDVTETIENSDCFGIYDNDKQIGFARVVSDHVIFAYLFDVFIIKDYRSKGLSKVLLNAVFENPKFKKVRKWYLATQDAHGLYQKFGFQSIANPERLMEKVIDRK
ncbi:MAG: GNAT family N-acetyltransferase [Ignavibacteriaceae bacterium]